MDVMFLGRPIVGFWTSPESPRVVLTQGRFVFFSFSSSLTIPAPSTEVPQIAVPSGGAPAPKSKKGRVMVPTEALTTRYVLSHFILQ